MQLKHTCPELEQPVAEPELERRKLELIQLLVAPHLRDGVWRHGRSKSREYKIWAGMKARCSNPKETVYRHYGGRGIKVCNRWSESFITFFMDMGKCPSGFELERIDNDGDYTPNNCIWSDHKTNCNNKRNCRYITANGKRHTVATWSDILGIPRTTLYSRLDYGWTHQRVIEKQTV